MPIKLAEANAKKTIGDHVMNHHMVAGAAKAAPHYGVTSCFVWHWPPLVLLALASLILLDFATSCFWGVGPDFKGQPGPKTHI